MIEYKHTEDMGEISGFGGGYEAVCQQMLHNGVTFLMSRKSTDLQVLEMENVYGLCDLKGQDGKELEEAVMHGIEDCTGAMHHAVMSRLNWINKNSWEAYCEELRKPESAA